MKSLILIFMLALFVCLSSARTRLSTMHFMQNPTPQDTNPPPEVLGPDSITLAMMGIGQNPGPRTMCIKFGVEGTCMNVNDCTGTKVSGLCPGTSSIKCCFTTAPPATDPRDCGNRDTYLNNLPDDYRTVNGNAAFYTNVQNVAKYRSLISSNAQTEAEALASITANYNEDIPYIIRRLTKRKNSCEAADYITMKLARIREGFLQSERNRAKFLYLGIPRRPRCSRPAEDPTKDNYIETDFVSDSNYRTVSEKMVNILKAAKNTFGRVSFGTYRTHSWGAYSADAFIGVPLREGDVSGFYSRARVASFLRAVDAAVTADGGCWRALYDDYVAAKEFNDHKRAGYVAFRHYHGPAPYVLHLHLDIHPSGV